MSIVKHLGKALSIFSTLSVVSYLNLDNPIMLRPIISNFSYSFSAFRYNDILSSVKKWSDNELISSNLKAWGRSPHSLWSPSLIFNKWWATYKILLNKERDNYCFLVGLPFKVLLDRYNDLGMLINSNLIIF
jgi:hypothetical protein